MKNYEQIAEAVLVRKIATKIAKVTAKVIIFFKKYIPPAIVILLFITPVFA
jgi:hypothetical protein